MAKNAFQVGFGEADITPSVSVLLGGYHFERRSTGIHDRLCARSMAVSDGKTRVVLCVCDLLHVDRSVVLEVRRLVQEKCGLPPESLIISVVHTHTSPEPYGEPEYWKWAPGPITESVCRAIQNLAPADISLARGQETGLQFIRRFHMKDGSVRTNPGIMNPDIASPIGTVDSDLHALLVSAGGRPRGGLTHYALHCDTVGSTEIGADWSYFERAKLIEKFGKDFVLLTPTAPCGDVNHWNVFAPSPLKGYAEAQRIGERVAAASLRTLEQAQPVKPGPVRALSRALELKTRLASPKDLQAAKRLLAQPAPKGVDFTMDRVEALRAVRAADIGPVLRVDVTVLAIGDVAIVGLPAEYFTELGRSIKSRSPFACTLVCSPSNGYIGYSATRQNYIEGGYEVTSSFVPPGAGEDMADVAVDLLRSAAEGRAAR